MRTVVAVLGIFLCAGCTGAASKVTQPSSAAANSAQVRSTNATTAPTPSPGAATPAVTSTPTNAATATNAATMASVVASLSGSGLQNVILTPAVRAQLVAAYVDEHNYQLSWIVGTQYPVYYAYDPSNETYLAWAGFLPAPNAPLQVGVGMQDGGAKTALRKVGSGPWHVYDICSTPAFLKFVGGRLPGGGSCTAPSGTPPQSVPDSACLTGAQALAQFVSPQVPEATLATGHGYACTDGWAYVNYVFPKPNADHATIDLQYVAGAWTVANRLRACGGTASSPMPAAIYEYGCGN